MKKNGLEMININFIGILTKSDIIFERLIAIDFGIISPNINIIIVTNITSIISNVSFEKDSLLSKILKV